MTEFDGRKSTTNDFSPPPTFHGLEAELLGMIESHRKSTRKAYPPSVPANPADAVQWFIKLMPGQKHNEAMRERSTLKGRKYWSWPYADRLKYLVRSFFAADVDLQNLVIAARQDRIEWRGDDLELFAKVIEETESMRNVGIEAYCKQAIAKMKTAMAGMGA